MWIESHQKWMTVPIRTTVSEAESILRDEALYLVPEGIMMGITVVITAFIMAVTIAVIIAIIIIVINTVTNVVITVAQVRAARLKRQQWRSCL